MKAIKLGIYTLPANKGWDIYTYEGYSVDHAGCDFYFVNHKEREVKIPYYEEYGRTDYTLPDTDWHNRSNYYGSWFGEDKGMHYDKFVLQVGVPSDPDTFEDRIDELPWFKVGYNKEASMEGKVYKTPMRHVDAVRIAQTVRALRPVITPDNPCFTPYDRGKWEQWQKQVHFFARSCFDSYAVDEDGFSKFNMDEFMSIAGVGNSLFDLAKFKVQGDEVA